MANSLSHRNRQPDHQKPGRHNKHGADHVQLWQQAGQATPLGPRPTSIFLHKVPCVFSYDMLGLEGTWAPSCLPIKAPLAFPLGGCGTHHLDVCPDLKNELSEVINNNEPKMKSALPSFIPCFTNVMHGVLMEKG